MKPKKPKPKRYTFTPEEQDALAAVLQFALGSLGRLDLPGQLAITTRVHAVMGAIQETK